MILLDAYALIAFLTGEPAAPHVRTLLRDEMVAITTVNLAETVDVIMRRRGVDPQSLHRTLDPLLDGSLATIPFDARHAWRAGEIRARHYHRTRRPLSAGDCALLAVAADAASVATEDPDVLAVAQDEGIESVRLAPG